MRVERDSVAHSRTIQGQQQESCRPCESASHNSAVKVRVPAPGALLTRSYYHSGSGTSMTGPSSAAPRQYPAHLQLCYRGVKYRPAALQLVRGPWSGSGGLPKV